MSKNTFGRGKYRVWIEKKSVGGDPVYLMGGGESPHVGGVSVCIPGEKPMNMQLPGHRDCAVTEMIARAGCEKHGKKATCIGGIHIDNANKEEIKKLVENCRGLIKWI